MNWLGHLNMEPVFLTLCLQTGAKLLALQRRAAAGAAGQGLLCCPRSVELGMGQQALTKILSQLSGGKGEGSFHQHSSVTPWEWASRASHYTSNTSHSVSEQGREDDSSGCVNHNRDSQLSCVGQREAHCTWLQGGGRHCRSLSILSVPLSATPQQSQLTCPRLCCQHQPEQGSLPQPPHQPPCLPGMRTLPLPPPVYEDAKSLLRSACAAFPEKKGWH